MKKSTNLPIIVFVITMVFNFNLATAQVPVASFSIPTGNICQGQTFTLTDKSTNNPTSWTWTMNFGTPNTSTAQNPSVSFSIQSTVVVTLVATNASGSSAPVSRNILINPNPTVLVSSRTICKGGTANLLAQGANTYTWSTGASGSSINVSPATTTTYTVTGKSASGCSSNNTASAKVTVDPVPNVTVTPTDTTSCSGDLVTIKAKGNADSYLWSTNATTATITDNPTTTTTYTVTGSTTATGCSKTATSTVTVINCGTTDIADNFINNQITVFPNPTIDYLNIDFMSLSGSKTAELFDTYGRLILQNNTENNTMKIDLNNVAKGSYYVKVSHNKNLVGVKMILISK